MAEHSAEAGQQEDFADAHARHLEDAHLLFERDRWANADQLYGLSAECGLKTVMLKLGTSGVLNRKYFEHIDVLWRLFTDFARERNGNRFLSMLPEGKPFHNWSIEDRYAHRASFHRTEVEKHRTATLSIALMVGLAAED